MLDYKYTELLTKSSIFRLKDRSKSSKKDISWESYFIEFFDLTLDVNLVRQINQGFMAYVSLWIPLI